jgi:hypothetical protein
MSSPWIQTLHGHVVELHNPDLTEVSIDEVAVALSRINRFSGHTLLPYNVAHHSVIVAKHLEPHGKAMAYAGLMHDAHEAFIGDITSPVKRLCGDAFRELDERMIRAVCQRWRVSYELVTSEAVKLSDMRTLATEKRDIMSKCEKDWGLSYEPWNDGYQIKPLESSAAASRFLQYYTRLMP